MIHDVIVFVLTVGKSQTMSPVPSHSFVRHSHDDRGGCYTIEDFHEGQVIASARIRIQRISRDTLQSSTECQTVFYIPQSRSEPHILYTVPMNQPRREASALLWFAQQSISNHIFGRSSDPSSTASTAPSPPETEVFRKTTPPPGPDPETAEVSPVSFQHTDESYKDAVMSVDRFSSTTGALALGKGGMQHPSASSSPLEEVTEPFSSTTETTKTAGESQATEYFSCTVHGDQLETKILSKVNRLVISKLEAERERLIEDTARSLLPQLEAIAAEAATREMDSFIEEVKRETDDEKVQAITNRLQDLSTDVVQRVFLQKSVVEVLKKLLSRLELDLAVAEWEEI